MILYEVSLKQFAKKLPLYGLATAGAFALINPHSIVEFRNKLAELLKNIAEKVQIEKQNNAQPSKEEVQKEIHDGIINTLKEIFKISEDKLSQIESKISDLADKAADIIVSGSEYAFIDLPKKMFDGIMDMLGTLGGKFNKMVDEMKNNSTENDDTGPITIPTYGWI